MSTQLAARPPRDNIRSWPLLDRIGYLAAWAAGLLLLAIAASILIYMGVKGSQHFDLGLLGQSPAPELDQSKSGGFKDPLIGTVIVVVMATLIALPIGILIAIWLTEYGRPAWLARLVESGIEIVAGTPSIVLAIFGLAVFQTAIFSPFAFQAQGSSLGRSFIACSAMMSLIALPLIVGSTREALNSIPGHVREASYALGKTKAATIRRVLLPAARPGIGTGTALGMGRVAGDTAIVVVLLGSTLTLQSSEGAFGPLRGLGSTLTSYVYVNSPAGEGLSPEKAYFAAFVLLLIVLFLNFVIASAIRGRSRQLWVR